jgi:hypothetical protein
MKVARQSTGKALPRTYVKVYGLHKTTNREFFFRDGYTDIRGKFEYSQTSGDKLKDVKRFAILVVSDEHGSKILESDPPKGEFGVGGGIDNLENAKISRLNQRQKFKGKKQY